MKKKLFSVLGLLILCIGIQAQTNIANYKFATSAGTYVPLAGATTFTNSWDDEVSASIPLGGNFTFGAVTYTACFINANGYITFGASATGYTPLSTNSASAAIAAFGRDGASSTVVGATPLISYMNVGGATGEFVVEYKDHATYSGRSAERLNTQIRLDLTTGSVKFVYGSWTAPAAALNAQIGIRGNSTNWSDNVNSLNTLDVPVGTTCTWANPVNSNANNSTMLFSTGNVLIAPSNGLTYNWTPPVNATLAPVRTFTAVTGIATTSASINWTAPTGATQYNVQYRTPGSCSWTNFSGNPVGTNSVALTGLTPGIVYQVRVQSNDGTNNAIWSHIPNSVGTGNGYSASGTFSTIPTCPIPTALNTSTITGTTATFTWTPGGAESAWDVYYGAQPLTVPNATTVATATTSINSYSTSGLPSGTAHSVYVRANCGTGDLSNWTLVKNFTTVTTCTVPTALTISNISNVSATFSWTSVATAFDVYYGSATTVPNATTVPTATTATNSYPATSLTPATSYSVYVRANCGAGDVSTWTSVTAFTTLCNPYTTFPYTESFSATFPACWAVSEGATGATQHWEPSLADATHGVAGPVTGTHFMRLNVYNASTTYNTYKLNTPTFSLGTTVRQIKYNYFLGNSGYKGTTGATGSDPYPLSLQVSTDGGATWIAIYNHTSGNSTLATSSSTVNWQSNTVILSAYANQNAIFRFVSNSNFGSNTCNQAIDEFIIENAPACLPTSNIVMSTITPTTAVATWTAGATETAWDVYFGLSPLTAPTATTVPTATTSVTGYTLNSLTPSTGYDVYVRANCGGSVSPWTLVNSFTTPCLPPNVLTVNGSTRCGIGTTTLSATADPGSVFNWYANATGGSAIATGSVLTTPTISANTNFYVSAGTVFSGMKSVGSGANSGTGLSYNLTQGGYGGLKGQYLITAAELANAGITAGNITSLAFELTAVGSTLNGFAIEVGTTTLTAFAATAQNIQGGLTTVYPAATFTPALGVNTINFGTPFNWNGTSNIIVSISWSNNNTSNTSSTIKYDATSYYASQTYRKDSETAANMFAFTGATGAGTFSYGSSQDRPKFTFAGSVICESARTMVTATVSSPPALTLSSPAAICAGSGIATLSVTSTVSDYDSYTWTPTTGLFLDAAATVPYTGTASTVYVNTMNDGILNYNVNANNSVSGCATAGSASVAINPAPTSITITANPNPLCAGSTVSVSISANEPTPTVILSENFNGATNNWTVVDNSSASVTSIPWHLAADGSSNSNAEVINTNDNSQFMMTDANSSSSSLTVNTTLTSPAFSTQGFTSANLDFYHYYYYGSSSFHDDGIVRISTDNTNWTVVTTYTTNQGAPTSFVHAVLPIPAAFVNQPVVYVQFQSTGGWGYFWHLDNVTVSGTSSSSYSYNWTSTPTGFTSTSSMATDMPLVTTTYSAVVTNTATGCSNSGTVAVVVNALPTVTASASSASVCAGSSATLTAMGTATNFTWTSGGNSMNEVVTPTVATTYTVTGENSGCSNTATVSVGVNSVPSVTATATKTIVCVNLGESSIISWTDGVNTQTASVTPTVATTYTFAVVDGACTGYTTIFIDVQTCTGINAIAASATGINVYPNPTNGILNIAISSEIAGSTSIEVYDAIGKLVLTEKLNSETTTINTSKLTDGMYMYKVINNNKAIKIGKIVKQ